MLGAFLRLDFSITRRYPFRFVTDFLQVFLTLLVFYYLSKSVGSTETFQGEYFPYLIVGLMFNRFYQTMSSAGVSQLIDYQYMGLVDVMMVAPRARWQIYLLAGASNIAREILTIILFVLIVLLFFKTPFSLTGNYRPGLLGLTLLLTFLICQGLSLISGASILLWKRVDVITVTSSLATSLLTGVYFPIKILPEWPQLLANMIPFTHALRLIRYSLGASVEATSVQHSLIVLAGWTLLLVAAGLIGMRWSLEKVTERGGLNAI